MGGEQPTERQLEEENENIDSRTMLVSSLRTA